MDLNIQCAHCKASGTCSNSENGTSCAVCIKKHKLSSKSQDTPFVGIICSVCSGQGQVEPTTIRLQQRLVPILSMILVYFALALIYIYASKENFHELLAFAGTLIGSVTGYYFGGRNANSSGSNNAP